MCSIYYMNICNPPNNFGCLSLDKTDRLLDDIRRPIWYLSSDFDERKTKKQVNVQAKLLVEEDQKDSLQKPVTENIKISAIRS